MEATRIPSTVASRDRAGERAARPGDPWARLPRQQARLAGRLLAMAGVLAVVCALDRAVLDTPSVTWLAYAVPVLLAPRLVPLIAVPLVMLVAVALGWSDALLAGTVGWDELLKGALLVAIGLYAVRDVQRERELEEAKAGFLRLVSHELRTPLHHIKGFASTLLQTDLEWDTATERECLEAIDQSVDRLTRLVDTLLDMARIAGGCMEPRCQPCQPAALVASAVATAGDCRTRHPLHVQVPEGLPMVHVDPVHFERVLANLLSNAAKYSPAGSPIRVSARVERGAMIFRVADEGDGVAVTERRRIFHRFQRGSAADRSRAPGTGLGLAIVRELLTAQGGKLWVEPNVPRGSVFAVSLPLGRATTPAANNDGRSLRGGGGRGADQEYSATGRPMTRLDAARGWLGANSTTGDRRW